jgi:hypothetical protein
MRKICVLGILAMVWLMASDATVLAQRRGGRPGGGGYGGYRGYGGYGGYGDDAGVMALQSSAMNQASMRSAAQSSYLMGQGAAMQQSAMMQSGIRNTLSAQATAQTQSMLGQREANRDWWFQVQQQQAAGRQAYQRSVPAMAACGFGAGPGAGEFEAAGPTPEVAMDIIKWPAALQEKEFASRRALIEAPYRRSPPTLSVPTVDDYRKMVKDVNDMKAILEWRLTVESGLQTSEYDQAKAFLDKLGQEAAERAASAADAPKST